MRLFTIFCYLVSTFSQVFTFPVIRFITYRLADHPTYHQDPSVIPFSFKQPQSIFSNSKTSSSSSQRSSDSIARFNSAKRFFQEIQPPKIINPMSLRLEN